MLIALSIVVSLIVPARGQTGPLQERILHPLGTPTRPILLQPSLSTERNSGDLRLPITSWITFSIFMRRVEEANLSLSAQRYNVPIAQAQLRAAALFPDPTMQAG